MFKKKAKQPEDGIAFAVSIMNTVTSAIYQDILRENGIPFICRQQGAGGYMKIITGGLLVTDCIYVKESDLEQARALYEVYLNSEDAGFRNDEE